MSIEDLRARIETANGHQGAFHRERVIRDGLNANRVADTHVGDRVWQASRDAEDQVLDDIVRNARGVKKHNRELEQAAIRAAKIEQATHAMEHSDSWDAMRSPRAEAEAAVVELSNLRTALLRQIITLASTLATSDGRSIWTDVPGDALFPGGPDLFSEPEPDLVSQLVDEVDKTRSAAARRGAPEVTDDELEAILTGR